MPLTCDSLEKFMATMVILELATLALVILVFLELHSIIVALPTG